MYDSFFQSYIDQWSFRPIAVEDATLSVLAEYKNEVRVYSAEKLLSFILKYLKKCAEDFIGDFVKDAVISVPTCFNHLQRQSIKEAAALAGLNVLRIISSTNAAALAYNFNNQKDENKKETNVLVFDLGGGALGVSILTVGDTCAVESVAGNPHLGGEDFDNLLVDHCVVEFKRQYKKDIVSNPRAFRQLRNACEEAKCRLSSSTETNIKIDSLLDGIDFCRKISRQSSL
uniref:Heat shock protein 70 n=1 Tax=Panagrolaimus superbus TaxID=310955 RepID=A0A914XX61_9BILA